MNYPVRFLVVAALFGTGVFGVWLTPPATSQPVAVPSQAAHYQPPVVLSKGDAARLDRLAELLEAIERNTAPARAVKAGPDRLAVARAKCSACHTPARADAKGGGFALFNDDQAASLRVLDGRQQAAVRRAVEEGSMPPAGELTPAERSALTQ